MSAFRNFLGIMSNNAMALLVLVVILLITWILLHRSRWILPTGPFPWPIIGNLSMLMPIEGDNSGAKRLLEMSKKYGTDILSIKVGATQAIVLNKHTDIKEAYSKDEFNFVNHEGPAKLIAPGIAATDGAQWKEQRRFALSTLRDFGLGKNKAQDMIQDELLMAVEELGKSEGRPFNAGPLIYNMVANIICCLIFGHRFDYNDTKFKQILSTQNEIVNKCFKYVAFGYLIPPLIRDNIPGDIFRIEYVKYLQAELRRDVNQKEYKDHLAKYIDGDRNDYIDAFIKELIDHKDTEKEHWFTGILYHLYAVHLWGIYDRSTPPPPKHK
ncbi:unnamed protein product, partial [Owenia fusiformis]